jgi:hypothetical protein
MTDRRKNPWAIAAGSFIIPGFGHVYNGEPWSKGSVFFIGRFAGVVLFILYTAMYGWAVSSSAYLADMLPPARYFFFVYCLLGIIPWIFVSLYDASIVFSASRKMNDGEIPFRENTSLNTWTYAGVMLFLTLAFIFFSYRVFFGMA